MGKAFGFGFGIAMALSLYVGMAVGNGINHYTDYRDGLKQSRNLNNSVEIREASRRFAESKLELLQSFEILNPLSRTEPKPYEPVLRILTSQES